MKKTALFNMLLSIGTMALFFTLITASPSLQRPELPDASKVSKERLLAFSTTGHDKHKNAEVTQQASSFEEPYSEQNVKKIETSSIPNQTEPLPNLPSPIPLPSFQTDLPLGKLTKIIPYPSHEQTVYLTFDDGPGPYTKEIVSILDKNHILGSFFWVGHNLANWLKKDTTNESLIHDMIKKGVVIGSHTMEHTALGHKSYQVQLQLMEESAAFISEKIGHPVSYFRPPYGSVDQFTEKASEKTKQIIAYWNVDSEDWRYPRDPEKVLNIILSEVGPGSIILFHEKSTTVDMLQHIIDTLREKGYDFSPLPAPKK